MKTERANACYLPSSLPEDVKDFDPEPAKPHHPENQHSQRMSIKRQSKPHFQISTHRTPTLRNSFRRKRAEEERLERVADIWDQVRAEFLQERHELLSQKVLLQRALIAAQDRRADLTRHQDEETKLKKRKDEKKKKQEILAALQDKCRQSLALHHRPKNLSPHNVPNALSKDNQAVEGEREVSEESLEVSRTVDNGSQRRAFIPASSPMEEVQDENDEMVNDVATKDKEAVRVNSASRHQAQLYKLYGNSANKNISPVRQAQKITHSDQTGHLSASQIWTTLWSGSLNKLLQADQRFPQDLKETFSAHVRQGITKFRRPVCRSFTQTEDVPDLDLLIDQSKQHHIRVLHHKTQLMYRSSLTNQNRTNILLFNNPLPSVSDGDDGISRFLPPLEDKDSICTGASYLRGFQLNQSSDNKRENDENIPTDPEKGKHPLSVHSPVNSDVNVSQDTWHFIKARHTPKKEPRYHFLTEKEAQTKGAFRAKFSLDKNKEVIHVDHLSQVHRPGDTSRSLTDLKVNNFRLTTSDTSQSKGGQARISPDTQVSRLESCWQPLSMQALSEYKQQLMAEGHGEFQQGRPKIWNTLA